MQEEQVKKALPADTITSDMKLDKAIALIKDSAKPKKKTKKKAEAKAEDKAEDKAEMGGAFTYPPSTEYGVNGGSWKGEFFYEFSTYGYRADQSRRRTLV